MREGTVEDVAAIIHVRTSVLENHLDVAAMAVLGITSESLAANMTSGDLGCWVEEADDEVVAFAMTDKRDGQIFALFVLPGYEGRGFGRRLLAAAVAWLRQHGHGEAWLATGPGTRADGFYAALGWQADGFDARGEKVYRIEIA